MNVKGKNQFHTASLWLSLITAINILVIYLRFFVCSFRRLCFPCCCDCFLVIYSAILFECRESLSPKPSLRMYVCVLRASLKSKLTVTVGHCLIANRHHSYVNASTVSTVNLLCYTIAEATCFTRHNVTSSHPFFPLCMNTRPYRRLHWSLLLFQPLDSSARNVLDADEVFTPTIGWDAREAACTISRVSRATRANDNFPPARSSRWRKDTFSVNYTTWRVWKCSHPITLRKKVSLFCALYTMYVYHNLSIFEEKRPQHLHRIMEL